MTNDEIKEARDAFIKRGFWPNEVMWNCWLDAWRQSAAKEREEIAQMFEDAPALVEFVQNDKGGCLVCGFTPKHAVAVIRARGEV